jgi:hypothetical protein
MQGETSEFYSSAGTSLSVCWRMVARERKHCLACISPGVS